MNDDEMDETLIRGAREYNQPGAVPREEIWQRIVAARQAESGSFRPFAPEDDTVVGFARANDKGRRSRRAWLWAGAGIAAAFVLSTGVIIGRRMGRTGQEAPSPVAVAAVAAVAPVVTPPPTMGAKTNEDSLIGQIHEETLKTGRRVQELSQGSRNTVRGTTNNDQSLAYRLVVLRHLAGSEAMIATFRNTTQRGVVDGELARWSRELLSTTRLLEASQASDDPVMKRLLVDLDLVISQIVQYTARGTVNPEDLDLIEESINKRDVVTKLRNAIPAGRLPAGT